MSVVHRYQGKGGAFDWQGVVVEEYPAEEGVKGATVRWLIGPREKAPHFAMRYFEVEAGGWTSYHRHAHDHGVLILRGQAQVLLGEEEVEVGFGDVIYIPPNEEHQLKNIGQEPLGFICVIPTSEVVSGR